MFGSIFTICFSFPQHRMWEVRITQHFLLIPKIPLNSHPWIFLFSSMLTYLNGSQHTPCCFILLSLCLCCPSNIHFFCKSFYSSPKALPWTLPRCSLPLGTLHDALHQKGCCVCLHHEYIRNRGQGSHLRHLCFPDAWHRKSIQRMLVEKNYTLGKGYMVSVCFISYNCMWIYNELKIKIFHLKKPP